MHAIDTDAIRARFPALSRVAVGRRAAYLDGPGGTQVPIDVIAAMTGYLERGNSNLGGAFDASREAEAVEAAARSAVGDLIGARPDEVVFGQNMTSLTFSVSRALAREWSPGDDIVVTTLDHDANVTPWRLAAEDRGASVRVVDVHPADATLDLDSLAQALSGRPRVLAVTAASNAVGTVTPIETIVQMAHDAGALAYVDAVHYSAHRLTDVAALGADFLAASAYKFFGPHTGVLFGKAEHLERLEAYKVAPAPSDGPGKWETGTQAFESLAGVSAAVEYLASLGAGEGRRPRLVDAFARIRAHEDAMSTRFLRGLDDIPGVACFGITDSSRLADRVSTFAVAVEGVHPREVAGRMAESGVFVWDGHYYAVGVIERLGRLSEGGLVRIGFVHYNTTDEVDLALGLLDRIAG